MKECDILIFCSISITNCVRYSLYTGLYCMNTGNSTPPPSYPQKWRKSSVLHFSKICGTFCGIQEVNLWPLVK